MHLYVSFILSIHFVEDTLTYNGLLFILFYLGWECIISTHTKSFYIYLILHVYLHLRLDM